MRVVLHIGSTKTGSSALQSTLFARRAALLAAGALYSGQGVAASAHHLLAASIHPGAWRMHLSDLPEDRERYFAETAAAIVAEATAADAHTILLSSEYFWELLPPATYGVFADAFPGMTLEVIAFVRRQDEWAMSSYLQAVKSGESREFADWMAHWLKRPQSGLHYFRVINRWARLTGAKVHLLRYEDTKRNVFDAYCRTLGLAVDTDIELARINPSPTVEGLHKLLAVNRSEASEAEKAQRRREIMRAHRSDGTEVPLMTDAERAAFLAAEAASDRLLVRHFLGREGPLFGPRGAERRASPGAAPGATEAAAASERPGPGPGTGATVAGPETTAAMGAAIAAEPAKPETAGANGAAIAPETAARPGTAAGPEEAAEPETAAGR